MSMAASNKVWEEIFFWGAAIAIFIFAGGVMILTSHLRYKSERVLPLGGSSMARINEPIQPLTLGNVRPNGVHSLAVSCDLCDQWASGVISPVTVRLVRQA
jgi:hypothetical protein